MSTIAPEIECPKCGRRWEDSCYFERLEGSEVDCPACGEKLRVAETETVMYWSFCTEAEYEAQQAKERALCGHAARLQAAYKELLVEHRALAEKEVLEGLSEPEERRLAEVRQKLEHCEADLKQSWCQQQIVVARKNLEVLKAMLREARRNSGGEQQC